MINERREKLMQTIKSFNKSQKAEIFTLGNEIEDTPLIPSGIEAFDNAIGGGFKQGGHTIIWGQYSVGKTALILHTIANAQSLNKLVCYVNTEKPIEVDRFKFFGIDLDNLVYIEAPECAEQALEAMRTLCKDKVIDLFIVDSINGLCPKSSTEGKEGAERALEKKDVAALALTLSNFYNKVNAHVFRAKSAVIWVGQARTQGIGSYFVKQGLSGGRAQEFYAYQIIQLRHGQKVDNPKAKVIHYYCDPDMGVHKETQAEDEGFDVVVKLDKTNSSKSIKQNSEIHIPYYYDSGFKQPNAQEEKIIIDGTEEEKEIIRQKLIEKGVLKVSQDDVTQTIKELDTILKDVPSPVEPKKRGRKPKENK